MRLLSERENPFEINTLDGEWLGNHSIDPKNAKRLIRGFLRRKLDVPEYKKYRDDRDLAQACIEFAKSSYFKFNGNPIDEQALQSLKSLTVDQPLEIIKAFRILCRGYKEEDVQIEEKEVRKTKKQLLKLLKKAEMRNSVLLREAERRSKNTQRELHELKAEELLEIRKIIKASFVDPKALAHNKLYISVLQRRRTIKSTYFFDLTYPPILYQYIRYRIRSCDPDALYFPLRFLLHIPWGAYRNLKREWRNGASKEQLIMSIERNLDWDKTFESLKNLHDELKVNLLNDRSKPIKEMQMTCSNGCYLSTTLLAVTQTEGILWDFAKYLNRKNIRIFKQSGRRKVRHYPYEWDHKRKKYKNLRPTTRPEFTANNIVSARGLLQQTRLGSIVHPDVFSYLVDEFYDDRNKFAHGDISGRNFKIDAMAALFCLDSCMMEIFNYLKKD